MSVHHDYRHGELRHILLLIMCLMQFSLAGCQQDVVCEDVTSVLFRAGFYAIDDNDQESVLSIDSLSVYGVGRPDNLIYNNQRNVSRIELPVHPAIDSTGYVLEFPGGLSDTLWITYQRNLNLISVECGFGMFFDIERFACTETVIGSCELIFNQISNTSDEHLKVYLFPVVSP
jgi:hypothetical protein